MSFYDSVKFNGSEYLTFNKMLFVHFQFIFLLFLITWFLRSIPMSSSFCPNFGDKSTMRKQREFVMDDKDPRRQITERKKKEKNRTNVSEERLILSFFYFILFSVAIFGQRRARKKNVYFFFQARNVKKNESHFLWSHYVCFASFSVR